MCPTSQKDTSKRLFGSHCGRRLGLTLGFDPIWWRQTSTSDSPRIRNGNYRVPEIFFIRILDLETTRKLLTSEVNCVEQEISLALITPKFTIFGTRSQSNRYRCISNKRLDRKNARGFKTRSSQDNLTVVEGRMVEHGPGPGAIKVKRAILYS